MRQGSANKRLVNWIVFKKLLLLLLMASTGYLLLRQLSSILGVQFELEVDARRDMGVGRYTPEASPMVSYVSSIELNQYVPGTEFRVNNQDFGIKQNFFAAGFPSQEDWIAAWDMTSDSPTVSEIRFKHYASPEDITGVERLVFSHTCSPSCSTVRGDPTVVIFRNNTPVSHAVVWTGLDYEAGNEHEIYARCYDHDDNPSTDIFRVNIFRTNRQEKVIAVPLSSGSFVAVWQSWAQYGDDQYDIVYRLFNSSCAPVGSEQRANNNITGAQLDPFVAAKNNGFVIVWTSLDDEGWRSIYRRSFDLLGNPESNEHRIDNLNEGNSDEPTIAILPNGDQVAVWSQFNFTLANYDIYGRSFNDENNFTGNIFLVNKENILGSQRSARIIPLVEENNFLVSWRDRENSGNNFKIQPIDTQGMPTSGIISLNTSGLITAELNQQWVALFHEPGSFMQNIFAQIFSEEPVVDSSSTGIDFESSTADEPTGDSTGEDNSSTADESSSGGANPDSPGHDQAASDNTTLWLILAGAVSAGVCCVGSVVSLRAWQRRNRQAHAGKKLGNGANAAGFLRGLPSAASAVELAPVSVSGVSGGSAAPEDKESVYDEAKRSPTNSLIGNAGGSQMFQLPRQGSGSSVSSDAASVSLHSGC